MPTVTLLGSALLVLAIDQASKALVLASNPKREPIVFGPVSIHALFNHRVAERWPARMAMLLAVLVVEALLLIAIVELTQTFASPLTQIALGAALGGACGNVVDHLRRRAVVDFIDLGWWPVFNLADVAIVCGAVGAASALF